MNRHANKAQLGFSLLELLATIVIAMILAMAAIPRLQQRITQSGVDAYTSRLEAGIRQLKANMINRQDSCTIKLPPGAGTETEIAPVSLENLKLGSTGFDCPGTPLNMRSSEGLSMAMNNTALRFVNIKNTLSTNQAQDIRLVIKPSMITLSSIAGVAMLDPAVNEEPLIIRVRSSKMNAQGIGFERCLMLAPMTGALTRGTWVGPGDTGTCRKSR
jgi:Tfp pilus assembly major pilin PilA